MARGSQIAMHDVCMAFHRTCAYFGRAFKYVTDVRYANLEEKCTGKMILWFQDVFCKDITLVFLERRVEDLQFSIH